MMCMIDDGDPCQIYHARDVRAARKTHRCDECGREIAIGESYRHAFGVYDGYPFDCHTCDRCTIAQRWLVNNCGGFVHEAVREDIEEHVREYPALGFGLSRLVIGMRRKWVRFDRAELMPVPQMPDSIASLVNP